MPIKWIIGILKALNSNQKPSEIGAAVAFAFWLALIPSNNLLWIGLFIITFFLKIHQGSEMIFLAIFKLFIFLFDGLLHPLGYIILTNSALNPLFAKLYSIPFVPFTNFNNTIVMGGFITGLVLFIPLTILFTSLLNIYRNKVMDAIANSKLVKSFMNLPIISTIVKAYQKASGAYSRMR